MTADKGKGAYVAQVAVNPWDNGGPEFLSSVTGKGGDPVLDFEEAVKLAEESVQNGNVAQIEVLELTVARRATIKRSVEVSVR